MKSECEQDFKLGCKMATQLQKQHSILCLHPPALQITLNNNNNQKTPSKCILLRMNVLCKSGYLCCLKRNVKGFEVILEMC